MSVTIRSPKFSFVRFNETEDYNTCSSTEVGGFCLPVVLATDVAFQFVAVADTVAEADKLCDRDNDLVTVGLVSDCDEALELTFAQKPDRFRVSPKEVLYNWPHGLTGFDSIYGINECFRIKAIIAHPDGDVIACSNCFERIAADCYTSVIAYGGTENQFDFNYCNSGQMFDEEENATTCPDPTQIYFSGVSSLDITYTSAMQAKYGDVPTVEIWLEDEDTGEFILAVIRHGFDAYPPTRILADLGGLASGFIKIS